jgi:hypothetical protein
MSFKAGEHFALDIPRALETTPVDETLAACIASYTLWVFDESQGDYVSWDSMVVILEETLQRKLYSGLWFDMVTGDLTASFEEADVEGVKELFKFNQLGVEIYAVKF